MGVTTLRSRFFSAVMAGVLLLGAVFCFPGVSVSAKESKLIAFTFDDGPGAYTSDLIDELDARGAKATFFMLGQNIGNYTDVVKKMHASGHELGNHSWDHPFLPDLSYSQAEKQIMDTNALLEEVDGNKYHIVRCPYGSSSDDVSAIVNTPLAYWSVDTSDWESRNADSVYNVIMENAYDGAIILAHDIYKTSVDGMLRGIDSLQDQGYECVTVSELLRRRGVKIDNGTTYFDALPGEGGGDLPAETPPEEPIGTVYVTASTALRQGTDKESAISGIVPAGSIASLLNKDDDKKYKVRSPWGEEGYLPVSSLQELEGDTPPITQAARKDEDITPPSDPVNRNMRTVSCTDIYNTEKGGIALGRLPAGSPVTLLEYTTDSVAMIKSASGTVAYVAMKFLEDAPAGAGRPKRDKDDKGVKVTPPQSGAAAIDLNLRKSPSSSSLIESIAVAGTQLTVTEEAKNNWCKVRTDDGREGYVQTYFVGTDYTAAKTTAEVNFRPEPNTKKDPIALLPSGTEVRILSKTKDWVLVMTSDQRTGYLSAEFVEAAKKADTDKT